MRDETTTALARHQPAMPDVATLGGIFAKSGYFRDARDASQAIVRIMYGQELGIAPVSAVMGIHIIEGRPAMSANLMAAVVRNSGRYDFRVLERTDERCVIAFIRRRDGAWHEEGRATWTTADSERAELHNKGNWKKYPRAMLFARAMSEGARSYCPDLFGGAPVYTPEELAEAGAGVDPETGEVLEHPSAPIAAPAGAPTAPLFEGERDEAYWRRRCQANLAQLHSIIAPDEPHAGEAYNVWCRQQIADALARPVVTRRDLDLVGWRKASDHAEALIDALAQSTQGAEDEDDGDAFGEDAEGEEYKPPAAATPTGLPYAERAIEGPGSAQRAGL